MPNTDGHRSNFTLTNRDQFPKPSQTGTGGPGTRSSLDAEVINRASDALIKIETWSQNCIRLDEGLTPAISPTIQRWLVTLTSDSDVRLPVTLNLSPAFLEDCGAIPTQSKSPDQAQYSLAFSLSAGVPRYIPSGIEGAPSWTKSINNPIISVRLIGAGPAECISADIPVFLDLGDGISPAMRTNIFYSHPTLFNTELPSGTYEISLLVFSWVD